MKSYLKKLGKTKFQAFLIITFTNIIMLIGSVTGWVNIDGKINEWMPTINLIVQLVATLVYTQVEGSIDKASIKAAGQEYTTGGSPDVIPPIDTDSNK